MQFYFPLFFPLRIFGKSFYMYFFIKEPNADKNTLIYLIYHLKDEGVNFKYSTGQKVHPEDWSFDNRLPKTKRGAGGVDAKHLTTMLSRYSVALEKAIKDRETDNKPITRQYLKNYFDKQFKDIEAVKRSIYVVDAIEDFIDIKNRSGGQSKDWNEKYKNLKKKLTYFEEESKQRLTFEHIDQDWLGAYCGFLRTIKRKPFSPLNDNSLHRNINFFLTFMLWADGKYYSGIKLKNPVKKYQPDDVHLTSEEIETLASMDLNAKLILTRDLFLIGVYSGQRFSDYSVFEKADVQGDMIIKKAEKTEKESFIPLHPKLKGLLDKYDWKLPRIGDIDFNINIKKICKIAGIDEEVKEIIYRGNEKEIIYRPKYKMVSSHTARRTFITLSSERGMPDHVIMKITGIRDPKTLVKYKKTSQRSVSESMNKYWG